MKKINFCKFHGFGNDYIVFEANDLANISSVEEFARNVCQRHTGIGSDGIAVLEKLDASEADYHCEIVNPDGSVAGFSGNGTRCAVAYLFYRNLWSKENLKLRTRSGTKSYQFLKREENTFWFLAELGRPDFEIPTEAYRQAAQHARENNLEMSKFSSIVLPGANLALKFIFVDVGNPVACIFVDDFDEFDWRHTGRFIETYVQTFPDRTNVVFVKIVDRENIEIKIWERGAGETASSGTCSIAAAVASAYAGKTNREVSVHAPGGTIEAIWRAEDDEMLITGRADLAFCGEWTMKS